MRTYESIWQDAQGIEFHLQGWEPERKPKAVVALIHGLSEHAGRYASMAASFAASGYCLIGYDLRGHGRSAGPRGHTPSYETLLDDIDAFLAQVKERYPKLPIFLYGHSLGGNLVLNFCLRRRPKLEGVIVTAPWLELAFKPPAWRLALARIANMIAPSLTQRSDLEEAAFSHDPAAVDDYRQDPLVHDRISARLFVTAYDAGRWALEHAAEFPLPLLLMHGTADRVTSADASRDFAGRAGRRVTWRPWAGLYHELHNETNGARVLHTVVGWMNGRLREKRPTRRRAGQKRRSMREFRPRFESRNTR